VIPRYLSPQMATVFSDSARFEHWRRVELAVLDGYVRAGMVSPAVADAARSHPAPSPQDVNAREQETGHDVVAFLQLWTADMPVDVSCRIHRGLTSSDIVDTALALIVREATELIMVQLDRLVSALVEHALVHRETLRIGRTHGQYATVDTWGHRVADFAFAADRARTRVRREGASMCVAKLSGTTGCYTQVPPEVEWHAAEVLGLLPVDVATQVVMRDRLAGWMFSLAAAAAVCEAIALEVRLGQRTEVAELAESASGSRVGSSSMPHKRNPITSEKICGLSRLIRSYVNPVLEGVALWHERDLTHSSVERVAVADTAALTEHVLASTVSILSSLDVNADQMRAKLTPTPVAALTNQAMVRLADAGLSWTVAHDMVQSAAAFDSTLSASEFLSRLSDAVAKEHPEIGRCIGDDLLEPALPDLDQVFDRLAMIDGRQEGAGQAHNSSAAGDDRKV
jgi:adenylosuccinate lyase